MDTGHIGKVIGVGVFAGTAVFYYYNTTDTFFTQKSTLGNVNHINH